MWPSGVRRAFVSGDQLLYKRGLPYWGPKPKIDMLELLSIGVGVFWPNHIFGDLIKFIE